MPITTPAQLAIEFKKSGEFDRLRRQLLAEFQNGESMPAFMARVEDLAKQKLASDPKLQYMPETAVHRELMQELDRYPLVERAVADAPILSESSFTSGLRQSILRILQEDRGIKVPAGQASYTAESPNDVTPREPPASANDGTSSMEVSPVLPTPQGLPIVGTTEQPTPTVAPNAHDQSDLSSAAKGESSSMDMSPDFAKHQELPAITKSEDAVISADSSKPQGSPNADTEDTTPVALAVPSELANLPEVPSIPREADNAGAPIVVSVGSAEPPVETNEAPQFAAPETRPNGEEVRGDVEVADAGKTEQDMEVD